MAETLTSISLQAVIQATLKNTLSGENSDRSPSIRQGNGTAAAFNSLFNGDDSSALGPIGTGGWFLVFNPVDPAFVVTDASNHLLRLEEAGGVSGVTYEIALIGRSA